MSDVELLSEDQRALYEHVPADGSTKGNGWLRQLLGWDSERYFAARDALEDAGLVLRGRGQGGTVRRAVAPPTALDGSAPGAEAVSIAEGAVAAVAKGEAALYAPMRGVIETAWARDHRKEPLAVEVTAQQGSKPTGGIWSRPDIVSVEVRVFHHVPNKHLELVTFEVKPAGAANVQAVYEALAHRRAATHSYVLLHVPESSADAMEPAVKEVCAVARPHGIGVVTAGQPHDYETWEEREEAQRVEPDPERLDQFIAQQLSPATATNVAKRLR